MTPFFRPSSTLPPPPDTPLAACCDTENTADVDQLRGWVRDLTQEGVEPNPGPTGGGATDDDSKVRVNFVVLECRVGLGFGVSRCLRVWSVALF